MLETVRPAWRDYLQISGLPKLAGCATHDLPATAAKELVDNAMDESPSGGVTAELIERGIVVTDTGRGLSVENACRIFSINRDAVSSKKWRMARRGMLGNGSRIIHAVAHVSGGSLVVESNGIAMRLGLDLDGFAVVAERWDSTINKGTRITLTIGPRLPWYAHGVSTYVSNALLVQGVAFIGTKACASYFDAATLTELLRDVDPMTTVMRFIDEFDLKAAARSRIKAVAARMTTRQLLEDGAALQTVVATILEGGNQPRTLRPIGRGAISGEYATSTGTFRHGDIDLPYSAEVWASGWPTADRKTMGKVEVDGLFINRTPSLDLTEAGGYVVTTGLGEFNLGNCRMPITTVKGPCNFAVTVAITAPDLPLMSMGKAVDISRFADGLVDALGKALAKAYVKPSKSAAETAAEERAEAERRRQAERDERDEERYHTRQWRAVQRRNREQERAKKEAEKAEKRRQREANAAVDKGVLGEVLARARGSASLDSMTVLSKGLDPYRLGYSAINHRIGQWVAEALSKVADQIHVRGLHYNVLVRLVRKPDGSIYGGDDWHWMTTAAKIARWLGYVPFTKLFDQRNDPPIIAPPDERAIDREVEVKLVVDRGLTTSLGVELPEPPSPDDIMVDVSTAFPRTENPFRLMLFGEKSGLAEIVAPIAAEYSCDSIFPAGEISDTALHDIAAKTTRDGRELVMFTLADCDPSGRQMPISIAHKLRAFRDSLFPDFRFRVVPLGLEPDKAIGLGLPQSRLKVKEKRGQRWRSAFGMEQVELDALMVLAPDALRQMVREGLRPYFDTTLADRRRAATKDWLAETEDEREAAAQAIEEDEVVAGLRAEAVEAHEKLCEAIRALAPGFDAYAEARNKLADRMESLVDEVEIDWPDFTPPEPELEESRQLAPLVHSDMTLAEHSATLNARKSYGRDLKSDNAVIDDEDGEIDEDDDEG